MVRHPRFLRAIVPRLLRGMLQSLIPREQLFLPVLELLQHGAQRDTARLQEHQQVIEEIGRLGRETVFILRIRCNYDFDRLFADLLRDLAPALFQQ